MLSDERREIRTLARQFAAGEIRPRAAEWDEAGVLGEEIFRDLAELGFLGMRVPEAYGGLDLDPLTYLLVLEELAWGDPTVALQVSVQNGLVATVIREEANDEQKERWLPALAAGELLGAFALSEPEAGSDATGLETRARREGEGWILEGRKKWVTNGGRADRTLVFARTGEAEGAIGAFFVDRSAPGYEVSGRAATMGFRASETVEVVLHGVQVPDEDRIGDPEDGFAYAARALDLGRLGVSALSVGLARAALEHAAAYAREREQFGTPIGRFGAIREKLARTATEIGGARALAHRVAEAFGRTGGEEGGPGLRDRSAQAAMAKVAASEVALRAADEAVQIYGGYGYIRDYPVEKLLRDAKGTEIVEGANEILREIVARAVLDELPRG